MNLTLGIVTDLHFGPAASFGGKLRKLTHRADELTRAFAETMRDEVRPDLVVNLGDVLEDEAPELDRARYAECMRLLALSGAERLDVAGNHDVVHLDGSWLRKVWGLDGDGPLYRSLDRGGVHLVVLATHETKDVDVRIDDQQLAWLESDLAATTLPTVVLMHHSAAEQHLIGNRWFSKAPHLALVKERRRLRGILEASGKVVLVVNGHLHWNHLDVIRGIPYVTVQSLIENLDDDAPGRPAAAHAIVRIGPRRVSVEIGGAETCRYQFELSSSLGAEPFGSEPLEAELPVSSIQVPPT
jgi:Icc protein